MRMVEILPSDIREFKAHLANQSFSSAVIGLRMTILGAIFTTAFGEIIHLHLVRGVKKPTIAKKPSRIITPEQYDRLYAQIGVQLIKQLKDKDVSPAVADPIQETIMQLQVDTDTETGVRWGELTELRPCDFTFETRRITVSRVVVELSRKHSPYGARFVVKEYPKDGEWRHVGISQDLCDRIQTYIKERGIGDDDLLFVSLNCRMRLLSARSPIPARSA